MTVAALTELFLMNMGYARNDTAEPDVVEEYSGVLLRWLNEGYARAVRRLLGREAVKTMARSFSGFSSMGHGRSIFSLNGCC